MAKADGQPKLAAIVAIDVAGYSARTLVDQAASAAEIASLRKRIAKASSRHGGRLFNSAGDGFMLEFPTASGAVLGAEALIERAELPIRIGIHLGEVQTTSTGDLLGHGVNVAARIQALASPRSVLVSDDIRRAVRGALARRFVAHGAVRLDKMGETVKVFSLGSAGAAVRARLAWRRFRLPLAAATLILLTAGGAAWLLRGGQAKNVAAQARMAILPFQVQSGDALARSAAEGMADEMATVLNGDQFVAIAADRTADLRGSDRNAALRRLHAAFLMDGSVTHEGNVLRAHVRLDDASGATVWSDSFSGLDAEPAALETDVANAAVGIAYFARWARLSPGGNIDAAVLTQYLKSVESILAENKGAGGPIQARTLVLPVVAEAPGFSRGHGALALADALSSHAATGEQRDMLMREAKDEAEKAKRLDPHSGEPYLALFETVPARDWLERERIAQQGVSIDPGFPYLVGTWGWTLAKAGRTREAIELFQRCLAGNAVHVRTNHRYTLILAEAGLFDAAKTQAGDTFRLQPAGWSDLSRLSLAMLYGTVEDARTSLDRSAAYPYPGEAPALDTWAAFLKARESGADADKAAAAKALARSVEQRDLGLEDVIPALAVLGDIDGAFAQLRAVEKAFDASTTEYLFAPATAPLRRDPRFWAFAARVGLVRYWQTSGHWPDVCQGGALADCKARAASAGPV